MLRFFRTIVFTATLTSVWLGFAPVVPMGEAEASVLQRILERIRDYRDSRQAREVPELDPTAAGGAVILVAGGAYLIAQRRRRSS